MKKERRVAVVSRVLAQSGAGEKVMQGERFLKGENQKKSQDPESNRDILICSQPRSLSAILASGAVHNCDLTYQCRQRYYLRDMNRQNLPDLESGRFPRATECFGNDEDGERERLGRGRRFSCSERRYRLSRASARERYSVSTLLLPERKGHSGRYVREGRIPG